ncbi:unnamed protein product [Lupinus luteus]|uniref:F-box domain-containing protein n=1 Tax=Lupinus luteus TaxID=3873 RepID=A0AAV1XEL8_LUPLU
MNHIQEDILVEILKHLPVKTLMQFRCVCKSWLRLITDPFFINTHLHFHTNSNRIIFPRKFEPPLSISPDPYLNSTHKLNLPYIKDFTFYYVKGHCHGLLCLIIDDGTIVLWNPSINQHTTLPIPKKFKKTREVLGFGFDSSINDYKIIRAPSFDCKCEVVGYRPCVEILTLTSNYWRKLADEVIPPYFIDNNQQSVTVNNAVYWLALGDVSTVVLKFNLTEEKFAVVPNPPDDCRSRISWVGVLNNSLCVLHSNMKEYFDIWATRDDCNWEKLITVSKILGLDSLEPLDYAPLCFNKDGSLVISVTGKGLFAYDVALDEYTMFSDVNKVSFFQEDAAYTESLVSPETMVINLNTPNFID